MAVDFSTLVTDRTQQDVAYARQLAEKLVTGTATEVEIAEWNSFTLKGVYNHTDLNRVTAAMDALKAKLEGYGYAVPSYQRIKINHNPPPVPSASRLPEGYMELSWIEGTGTQYVDTGFKPNQSTKVVMDLEFTGHHSSHPFAFGARDSTGKADFYAYINGGGTLTAPWAFVCGSILNQHTKTGEGRQAVSFGNDGMIVNGVSASVTAVTFQSTVNLWLFCANRNGVTQYLSSLKLYSCQIYDNGTMVRDYVPCINPDGSVGLYDLVTAAFFGNSGTGSFVAGAIPRELPDGYTQVEYIESSAPSYTSGQRIDTKFVPNSNTRVVCDFQFTTTTSSFQALLGSRSSSANRFCLWLTNGGVFRSDYNASNLSFPSSLLATEKHTLDFNKNVCSIDGSVVTHSVGSFNGVCNLFLFASDTDGSADIHGNVRIYACHIYDNGTLVRDFVSCKNASGVVGMYDMVNGVFYQNVGSGAFTVGEEIVAPATASVMVVSDNVAEYDPYTWYEFDWPTPETMTRYLLNVHSVRNVLELFVTTPTVPTDMNSLTVKAANAIEQILFDVEKVIYQIVNGFPRSAAFTFWNGYRPLPSATSDLGRTWEELDAMQTTWGNWQVADWYLLLYGNLKAEGVIE